MNGQPAIILKHPRHTPTLEPVCDDSGRVIAPAQPQTPERPRGGWDSNMRNDICVECGHPVDKHWSATTGAHHGCKGARRGNPMPQIVERWNDPYPAITAAVRKAMVDETCGSRLARDLYGYDNDEQLAIASAVARVAVAEYIKGLGQ